MKLTDEQLDEPNKVKASKCPICNGNLLICGIEYVNAKTQREFEKYESKYGCITTFITIRQARTQDMCFEPNNCSVSKK